MKKVLMTLAKWFHVDLTEVKYVEVEKVVEVPKIEYKERTVALGGTVDGDLTVMGNLTVTGELEVMGGICSCLGVADACVEKGAGVKPARKRNEKGQFIKG